MQLKIFCDGAYNLRIDEHWKKNIRMWPDGYIIRKMMFSGTSYNINTRATVSQRLYAHLKASTCMQNNKIYDTSTDMDQGKCVSNTIEQANCKLYFFPSEIYSIEDRYRMWEKAIAVFTSASANHRYYHQYLLNHMAQKTGDNVQCLNLPAPYSVFEHTGPNGIPYYIWMTMDSFPTLKKDMLDVLSRLFRQNNYEVMIILHNIMTGKDGIALLAHVTDRNLTNEDNRPFSFGTAQVHMQKQSHAYVQILASVDTHKKHTDLREKVDFVKWIDTSDAARKALKVTENNMEQAESITFYRFRIALMTEDPLETPLLGSVNVADDRQRHQEQHFRNQLTVPVCKIIQGQHKYRDMQGARVLQETAYELNLACKDSTERFIRAAEWVNANMESLRGGGK